MTRRSGNGVALDTSSGERDEAPAVDASVLASERSGRNSELLSSLKEDKRSQDLLRMCCEDAEAHRMCPPVPVATLDLSAVTLSPRFCVEQGGCLFVTHVMGHFVHAPRHTPRWLGEAARRGRLHAIRLQPGHGHSDTFLALLRAARKHLGHDLCLWKADIDSAYRRIPVDPSDREFAWVAFLRNGTPVAAQHVGLPFGSVASVHHWDRVGVVSLLSRLSCMTCCVCPRLADSCNRAQVAPPTSVTVCG